MAVIWTIGYKILHNQLLRFFQCKLFIAFNRILKEMDGKKNVLWFCLSIRLENTGLAIVVMLSHYICDSV